MTFSVRIDRSKSKAIDSAIPFGHQQRMEPMTKVGKQVVSTRGYRVPSPGFVQAVSIDKPCKMVFVSGVTARMKDGGIDAIGDPAGQTRRILANLADLLRAAGGTLDDLVHTVTYLTDIAHLDAVQEVKVEFFKGIPPASTTVQVTRLVDERQLVEIEGIAVISQAR
jgi:enamine deaminase RidA (YjgF/YER057c/UK114 family)